jgi:hypothetical protein
MTYRTLACSSALSIALLAAGPAVAQEEGPTDAASVAPPDEEEEDETEEDKEQKLETTFMLTSEAHSMNNLDLRRLDETSDQDIIETDDRNTFAYSSLAAELEYQVLETTEFNFAGSHTGLWGSDQIGSLAPPSEDKYGSHFLWVYRLNAEWEPIDNDTLELETKIGRQDFEIGGAEDDYFFDDTVDAVTLELDLGEIGNFRALALDFYSVNSSPEDADFVQYSSRNGTVMPFRGDTNTRRHGLVYENTKLIDGLELRAFGFYADIGASTEPGSTGSDRSYNGSLGNISDSDFLWMGGTRAGYTYEGEDFELGAFGEFARSGGIDRKDTNIGVPDVDNNGNAYGAGAHYKIDLGTVGLKANARYFHADGGVYGSGNGMQGSHGFVSFKGDEVGGLNLDRYAGFHPSSYVGRGGIQDTPNETSRKSGTEFLQAGLGFEIADKLTAEFDAWYLMDTSYTYFKQENLSDVASELPFGYTESDLEAQERFGKPIGTELDASVLFRANKALNFYAKGGVFLPAEYYQTEISRSVAGDGTALGSPNPQTFWAATAGTSLKF